MNDILRAALSHVLYQNAAELAAVLSGGEEDIDVCDVVDALKHEACSEAGACESLRPAESILDTLESEDLEEETVREELCALVGSDLYGRIAGACATFRTFADAGLLDEFNRYSLRLVLNDVAVDGISPTQEGLRASLAERCGAASSERDAGAPVGERVDAAAVENHARSLRLRVDACVARYDVLQTMSGMQMIVRDLITDVGGWSREGGGEGEGRGEGRGGRSSECEPPPSLPPAPPLPRRGREDRGPCARRDRMTSHAEYTFDADHSLGTLLQRYAEDGGASFAAYRVVHPLMERVSFKVSSPNDTHEFVDGVFTHMLRDIDGVEELFSRATEGRSQLVHSDSREVAVGVVACARPPSL